tara:strand:- start:118 stop:549 length:432 start_codon:yes stop_codon:yes gene_type:complete
MKKTLLTLALLVVTISINAQTIFGKWNSKNEETGKVDSVIEVYEKNGKAYAKVIEIMNEKRRDALCIDCEGENKNKPILGLDILSGLEEEEDNNEWSGGEILDPRNGKVYKCYIELVKANKLKIRGYIGVALFGKTAYWERAK